MSILFFEWLNDNGVLNCVVVVKICFVVLLIMMNENLCLLFNFFKYVFNVSDRSRRFACFSRIVLNFFLIFFVLSVLFISVSLYELLFVNFILCVIDCVNLLYSRCFIL